MILTHQYNSNLIALDSSFSQCLMKLMCKYQQKKFKESGVFRFPITITYL